MNFIIPCILLLFSLTRCNVAERKSTAIVTISNFSTLERVQETVGIKLDQIPELMSVIERDDVLVRELSSEDYLVTQWVDNDQDGNLDELLFQVDIDSETTKDYEVSWKEGGRNLQPKSDLTTYSRFVPERTDDYAWENDKVAFRTFGPEAQRLIEVNEPGGTLSSGIDLWLKKVSYPIIDSWYAENVKDPGYYHIDHGEGCDPYHVGKSRGAGGVGIWLGDTLVTSRNFVSHKTIAVGPIRTIFELEYASWSDFEVKETKRISLDLGSRFSRFETYFNAKSKVPNYAIGITLHKMEGEVSMKEKNGWFSHWEPIQESFLGEGIVIDPTDVLSAFVHESKTPDQSQLIILTKPNSALKYYSGFAWSESGEVMNKNDWDSLLQLHSEKLSNPLQIAIKK